MSWSSFDKVWNGEIMKGVVIGATTVAAGDKLRFAAGEHKD